VNPILAVLAGLIASAAFHPIDFWPALIVGIGILYKLNMDQPIKSRLLINFLFGIGYQLLTLYWVGTYVGSFAWIALVLMQAVFVIALSFSTGALTFAASWILFEFILRSIPFGGFG
jgi:apolipoprotein N-acyltransferase